ncbi:hypothetical protein AB3N59_16905 [Leptospira sp. WS92.C1]
MFESMKKFVLILLMIFFCISSCKKKEELVIGDWIKVKECPQTGECPKPDKGKGSHLIILPENYAKYKDNALNDKEFHLTYKLKDDDINFNLADLNFNLEYQILILDDKNLHLLNKKENMVEYFERQ